MFFRYCHWNWLLWMVPDPELLLHFRFLCIVLGSFRCGCYLSSRHVQEWERDRNQKERKGHSSSRGTETRRRRRAEGATQRQLLLGHHGRRRWHRGQKSTLIVGCWLYYSFLIIHYLISLCKSCLIKNWKKDLLVFFQLVIRVYTDSYCKLG